MKISLQFLMTCFWILSCLNMDAQKKTDKVAQQLIDQCIEAHGGSNYEKLNVTFDFRQYKLSLIHISEPTRPY